MEIVEFLMARRNWRNMCLRANIVPKEKIEMWKKTKTGTSGEQRPRQVRTLTQGGHPAHCPRVVGRRDEVLPEP
jgi:hypothetical protein